MFEVLGRVVAGAANRRIAQEIHVSLSTVKRHLERVTSKLGSLPKRRSGRPSTRSTTTLRREPRREKTGRSSCKDGPLDQWSGPRPLSILLTRRRDVQAGRLLGRKAEYPLQPRSERTSLPSGPNS